MPQLIRTPEDIFRAERRDVYALHFAEEDRNTSRATNDEMQRWFAQHMPDSPTEPMAPSEHSGFIEGGPIGLRIAFTDADLQRFCQLWEDAQGQSIDPRFQCYQYAYQNWWNKYGHYQPTLAQPQGPGASVWIESPLGTINHVLPAGQANHHPATVRDLWANACLQWPQLLALELDDLHHGQVLFDRHRERWMLLWNEPFANAASPHTEEHWRALADWLQLPPETHIGSEY